MLLLALACHRTPPEPPVPPEAASPAVTCESPGTTAVDSATSFDDLWDYGDPEATERAFLAHAPEVGEEGQLQTQLARTHSLRGTFVQAHALLDAIERPDEVTTIRMLLERGRSHNSAKSPEQAYPLFLEAWERACAGLHDFHAVDAAHMLGIVAEPDEAAAWNERALAVAEKSTDPRANRWEASLLNNIGWARHEAGDFEGAYELFVRATALRTPDTDGHRHARWAEARALRSLERLDEALAIQEQLSEGPEDGWVFEELALLLDALGRTDEARPWAEEALPLLEAEGWVAEEQPERLDVLRALVDEL